MNRSRRERELIDLDEDECAALLAIETIGRLAVAHPTDSPDVVPVNFVVREGDPVFRSHGGLILERIIGARVSLQVDRFDWFHRTGWSVLVRGVAEVVDPAEAARVLDGGIDGDEPRSGLDTWAPGEEMNLVRLCVDEMSGRRIELHQLPLDGRGYL